MKKRSKHGEDVVEVDEGITDKRLLAFEPEFARVLRVAGRDGNTLSAVLRQAWDTGNLGVITRHDPLTATGAHVCIVAHVTADELRAELTETHIANGLGNRFLFAAVKRSKLLPSGGADADAAKLQTFADRLHELMATARTRKRIVMSADALRVWENVYPVLSAEADGLYGAVTARAEAQVCRVALIYALLDGAAEIEPPHLLAALAVWQYCDATATYIFGSSLGDRIADEIMRRLRWAGDAGLTRTEISNVFKRNLPAERIGAALELLTRRGRAICETVASTDSGRPREVWKATK